MKHLIDHETADILGILTFAQAARASGSGSERPTSQLPGIGGARNRRPDARRSGFFANWQRFSTIVCSEQL